jgi:hypothetical protein
MYPCASRQRFLIGHRAKSDATSICQWVTEGQIDTSTRSLVDNRMMSQEALPAKYNFRDFSPFLCLSIWMIKSNCNILNRISLSRKYTCKFWRKITSRNNTYYCVRNHVFINYNNFYKLYVPKNLEIRNAMTVKIPKKNSSRVSWKGAKIRRRIKLCLREIIVCFESNLSNLIFHSQLKFKKVTKYLATGLWRPKGLPVYKQNV